MMRPESIPTGVVGSPADELDTSCLNCFSRRIGLIAIAWTLVVTSVFGVVSTIESLTIPHLTGGAVALLVIYLLIQLADVLLAALLLLGTRDSVVRTRLNIWMIWMAAYVVLLLVLFIIMVAAVGSVSVGAGVISGLEVAMYIGFRLYGIYAGWMYRDAMLSLPPPASAMRPPETGPPSYGNTTSSGALHQY